MADAQYRSYPAFRRRIRSLSGRLMLTLLTIHLILAPLLVVFVLNTAARNYKDRFVDQARSDAQWVKALLEMLPADTNRQALLDDLALNPFRQSIQLFDGRDVRLAGAGTHIDSPTRNLREDFEFGQHDDELYWIELPLHTTRNTPPGTLWLAYDESPIMDDISRLYSSSLQLAVLYLALVAAAVMGFIGYLARSLRQIGAAAHHIATGHYQERFTPHTQATEIVDLATDLEHMRMELVSRGQLLAEQGRYLHTLLDHIVEGVVTFDMNGIIETCNPAALKLFTDDTRKPDGLKITDWLPDFHIPDESDASAYANVRQMLGRRKDGSFITVELAINLMVYDSQHLYLALIRDISEYKRIEEERRKNREELTHARRLSSMGEMAAGLAHELNQPLAAINLYIQGGLQRLGAYRNCPADIKSAMENASLQAQRAGEIIRQIRGFVKKAPPKNRETDINQLIDESIQLLETELTSSGVSIQLDLSDERPTLQLDRLQIQQVLINLITNGIDAMENTAAENRVLSIRTHFSSKTLSIDVEDRGTGIPKDIAKELFAPFVTHRETGLGLGLAISHSIIEEHGGQLNFKARTGGGTIFTITLPANATAETL